MEHTGLEPGIPLTPLDSLISEIIYQARLLNSFYLFQNGKAFHADRIKSRPKYFSDTESGRYAEFLLNASERLRGMKDREILCQKLRSVSESE